MLAIDGTIAYEFARLFDTQGSPKKSPAVRALALVDFALRPGETHVLFGEKGAGESILIKVLISVHNLCSSMIRIWRREALIDSRNTARCLDARVTYQEFNLVPNINIAQHTFKGRKTRQGEEDPSRERTEPDRREPLFSKRRTKWVSGRSHVFMFGEPTRRAAVAACSCTTISSIGQIWPDGQPRMGCCQEHPALLREERRAKSLLRGADECERALGAGDHKRG